LSNILQNTSKDANMQISVEKTGDLERRMVVQVPEENIEGKISSRLDELRRQVRLKGFRPGRVPLNIIRSRYGKQVREEIMQEVMQSSLQEAIGEQKLRVAGITRIEPQPSEEEKGDFSFTADLEVFPDIPEIDVSDVEVERPEVEIADADIDRMIDTLREQRREWVKVERAAADGDRVHVSYVAELDGERIPEEGAHELMPVIGQTEIFPQLEELLRGKKAGDEVEGELEFPESYRHASLAGKTAPIKLNVKAVEESDLPEVDDEFASAFGVEGGVEKMRADVRENLEREARQVVLNRLKDAVTAALAEQFGDVGIPKAAIDQEVAQMQQQIQQQGGQPPAGEQLQGSAEKRVRLGLLMAEIARQKDISIDPARVQGKIEEIAGTYDQPEQIVEIYRSEPQLMDQIENMVLEEQVVDWVLENARVSNKALSFDELMGQA